MNTIGKKISALVKPQNMMMAACCVAMVGAFFLFAGSEVRSSLFSLALPLAACIGMHLVMHKMMGKSCHGTEKEKPVPGKSSMPDSGSVKSLPETTR